MNAAVVKISSKGQITLPVKIRNGLKSDTLAVVFERDTIKMKPIFLAELLSNDHNEDSDLLRASVQGCDFWDSKEDAIWDKV